jgi:urease subunit gamma/beta
MAASDVVVTKVDAVPALSSRSAATAVTLTGSTPTQARASHSSTERESVCVDVLNTAAHAIRVRSSAHFFEVNRALKFDRAAAFGMTLDQRSGTSIRFQPGEIVRVCLVRTEGTELLRGFSRRTPDFVLAGEVKRRGLRRS